MSTSRSKSSARKRSKFGDWCILCWGDHSLSIVLFVCAVLSTIVSYLVPYGTWVADFWLGISGAFCTALFLTIVQKFTWEKDSDPTKKPK